MPRAVVTLDPLLSRRTYRRAQNNYAFDALVPRSSRNNPLWDTVDCQYWALSCARPFLSSMGSPSRFRFLLA